MRGRRPPACRKLLQNRPLIRHGPLGRATSCPRCGIRFPGPLGHGNRAAAWLCPRFIRRRRRFGHRPPRGRLGDNCYVFPSTRPRRSSLPPSGPPGASAPTVVTVAVCHPPGLVNYRYRVAVDWCIAPAVSTPPHLVFVHFFPHKVPNLHKNRLTKAASCLYNTVCAVFGAANCPLRQGQGSAVE